MTEQSTLYKLTVICRACGNGHLDIPGDDSTWRCRKCDQPLRRSKEGSDGE